VQVLVFILAHGISYHCLWASHSTKMYREEAFRFEYMHHFSNGAGLVAWCGAVVIAITSIPAFRRNFYWVRALPACRCQRAGADVRARAARYP
jgi:hypothetical protein